MNCDEKYFLYQNYLFNNHIPLSVDMVFYLDSVYFAETINVPIFENEIIARKAHKRGNTQEGIHQKCVFVTKWYTNII